MTAVAQGMKEEGPFVLHGDFDGQIAIDVSKHKSQLMPHSALRASSSSCAKSPEDMGDQTSTEIEGV